MHAALLQQHAAPPAAAAAAAGGRRSARGAAEGPASSGGAAAMAVVHRGGGASGGGGRAGGRAAAPAASDLADDGDEGSEGPPGGVSQVVKQVRGLWPLLDALSDPGSKVWCVRVHPRRASSSTLRRAGSSRWAATRSTACWPRGTWPTWRRAPWWHRRVLPAAGRPRPSGAPAGAAAPGRRRRTPEHWRSIILSSSPASLSCGVQCPSPRGASNRVCKMGRESTQASEPRTGWETQCKHRASIMSVSPGRGGNRSPLCESG